jgi:hypothetical protein
MNTQQFEFESVDDKTFAELDILMQRTPLVEIPEDFANRLQTILNETSPTPKKLYTIKELDTLRWTIAGSSFLLAMVQLLRFILGAWLITQLAY